MYFLYFCIILLFLFCFSSDDILMKNTCHGGGVRGNASQGQTTSTGSRSGAARPKTTQQNPR